jgi:hypothetical protein
MSEPDSVGSYDRMFADVDLAIAEIREKIEDGRVRSPEHDKVRIQFYRALGYLIRTRADVLETKELEQLAERVEQLEER